MFSRSFIHIFIQVTLIITIGFNLHQYFYKLRFNEVQHSSQEIKQVYNGYKKIIEKNQINENKNQKLSFAYCSDVDIILDGVQLMQELGFYEANPIHHENIDTLKQVSETFAYYLSQGSASEMEMRNEQQFLILKQKALKIAKEVDLGGNSAIMAHRAYLEGSEVLLGAVMNQKAFELNFNSNIQLADQLAQDIRDVHIVIEYQQGQKFGNLVSPRSNRFYLNFDIDNTEFSIMDKFHQLEQNFQSDIIALSGFQLLKKSNMQLNANLFQKIDKYIQNVRKRSKIPIIHVELADIQDPEIFQAVKQTILNQIGKCQFVRVVYTIFIQNKIYQAFQDRLFCYINLLIILLSIPLLQKIEFIYSVGFNEQELSNWISLLANQQIQHSWGHQIQIHIILDNLVQLIKYIEKGILKLNRLHFHTVNSQIICNNFKWESPLLALSKSIYSAHQTANIILNHEIKSDNYDFHSKDVELSYPINFLFPRTDNKQIEQKFNPKNPVNCWDISDQFNCCISPNAKIINPKRTRGLGDHISASGLVYHKLKKQ